MQRSRQPESDPYAGYKRLAEKIWLDPRRFSDDDSLTQVQAEVARLTDPASIVLLASEVDEALNKAMESGIVNPRQAFALRHFYGLTPELGNPKTQTEIGRIIPREAGGIGLSRGMVRSLIVRGESRLFRYQRENPIAGLSFNS